MHKSTAFYLPAFLILTLGLAGCDAGNNEQTARTTAPTVGEAANGEKAASARPGDASPAVAQAVAQTDTTPASSVLPAPDFSAIDIPYKKYVLDNGLTLIVHEDHKAPIVAVNVWYHVGSKNEKEGKTGFAHLFEHLMFNGSENYNDDYFKPFDRVGATDMNGTTDFDRTNYFQNVPNTALDMALWMESDRMGNMLGAVDQARLDEQRGVVQNEKRQRENQPYGKVFITVSENVYPKGHPYSWSVIGSMEDLNAASLEDVHEWFKRYYGAANAVISVAGDVEAEDVLKKVKHYFANVPSGPPLATHEEWIAKRSGVHRQVMQDRVPQTKIFKVWNIPGRDSDDTQLLDLASDVIGGGKNSRLYKRLVYDDQTATEASAFVWPREIGSLFFLSATIQPGGDVKMVEAAMDEELRRFLADGPDADELARIKTASYAGFVRKVERIGGFGGKSDVLAKSQIYGGSPDAYKRDLKTIAEATPEQLRDAARTWLDDGVYILEVQPFGEYTSQDTQVDRKAIPMPTSQPESKFPERQTATLSNGLKIILAERHTVPTVQFNLLVDAGYAADRHDLPGVADMSLAMLDEGVPGMDSLQISEKLDKLGANLSVSGNLDMASVSLDALKDNLDASLAIYRDVILNPTFPEQELARLKKQTLATIAQEKKQPVGLALRVLPGLLYGSDHAYGLPLTGSGTEAAVKAMSNEDLRQFHATWFKPNNATMVIVGDTTITEIQAKLEALFKDWKSGEVPQKNIATVTDREQSEVYILDRPDSEQTLIIAGHLAPPTANPDEFAIEAANEILGGSFSARINMNLREDKHWSYGARSLVYSARGQRPFFVYAPVQTDKTSQAANEIRKELTDFISTRPADAEELARAKDKKVLTLPGKWETNQAVAGSIESLVRYGLPDDYWLTYAGNVSKLELQGVTQVAKKLIHPERLVWIIVGDRGKIDAEIQALKLGAIHYMDEDGNILSE